MKRVVLYVHKPNTYTGLIARRTFASQTPLWRVPGPQASKGARNRGPDTKRLETKTLPSRKDASIQGRTPQGESKPVPTTSDALSQAKTPEDKSKPVPSNRDVVISRTTPNIVTYYYEKEATYPDLATGRKRPGSEKNLDSTRPAPLAAPPAPKKEDHNGSIRISVRAKWLYHLGRSYVTFYKTGFKNIWFNTKESWNNSKALSDNTGRSPGDTVADSPITRRDYQLQLRVRHDLGKLLPFSLIFLICGEFTPFVIILFGSRVVPYTCRIPRQEQDDFRYPVRAAQRVADAQAKLLPPVAGDHNPSESAATERRPTWQEELIEAYRLKCSPFLPTSPMLAYPWWYLRASNNLHTRLQEILYDTILIQREGGFSKLSARDIFEWSLKAGLETLRVEIEKLQGKTIDPDSEELRRKLLPVVEEQARYMLDVDWKKVRPENYWLAAFRGEGSVTPDDLAVKSRGSTKEKD